jgi:hypothetical protein
MGGYRSGHDPEFDKAIAFVPSQDAFKELAVAMQPG